LTSTKKQLYNVSICMDRLKQDWETFQELPKHTQITIYFVILCALLAGLIIGGL
jgi:hypothetical protein